jgi:hypothetical protein
VRSRVADATRSLERAAAEAPTDETRRAARSCAAALHAAAFAVDADRLLFEGGRVPNARELADADTAIRETSAAVQGALEGLGALINPAA